MKKRILAFLLTLFMLASLFPAAALAESPAEAAESPAEEPAEDADVPEEAPAEEEAPEPEEESADEPAAETCKVDIYIQPGLEAGTARVVESSPYYVGQTITLKAEANSGYTFMWWINYETEEFSYSSTYQTTLTGDCEWDAVFKKSGEYFIYISKPYDEEGDNTLQVSPDQHSYPKDTEITLTAPAVPGRSIVYEYGKDVDGESASVDWIRIPNGGNKFKMPAYDTWVRGLYSHTITLNVGANGTASLNPASGPYYEGDVVTLTVNPNSGYRLKNISGVPSNYTSSGNTVTFTMEDFDVTLDVEFEEIPTTTYTIKAYPYPSGSGTVHMDVNGAGQVTLTATPLDGYHFYGWLDSNSNILSTDNPYSFTATKDITIYGFFYVQVIVYPNIEHGKVEVENYKTIYAKGDVITLIGTPDDGYVLDYFLAGELHGTSATLTKLNGNSFTMPANDMVVAAKFAKLHTITATANPTAGGTVTGAGSYKDGATVSLTATPKSGYDFVSWTENGSVVSTSAAYSFTATADRNLVANFQANTVTKYTISATANPTAGGTVSGAGEYEAGKTVTLTATPNSGYNFVNWTENGTEVSTSAAYSFTASANRTLVANFELKPVTKYTISATANPTAGGTVSGAGEYEAGKTVTLTATPNSGYNFVNWTENGTVVSTSAAYSFTASANRTLVANFELKPVTKYTISATANPTDGGSVSGAGEYEAGKTVTLTATPNSGYNFVNWTENGTEVSTSAAYSFTASANRTLVANFELKPVTKYTISATANPTAGGSVSGAGEYEEGKTVTLTATPNETYNFVSWTENGSVVSTSAAYTFTATANRTLVANFELKPVTKYTISATANPAEGGSVSGAGEYEEGKTVTLTATPNEGYRFVNWTENGTEVSTGASYSFTVSANRTLVANFKRDAAVIEYPLWIGGVRVTSENLSGEGWTYEGDASSGTLTLTDANITGTLPIGWSSSNLCSDGINLTLVLSGANILSGGEDGITIKSGNLTIQGDGSLELQPTLLGIRAANDLTITGGSKVVANAPNGLTAEGNMIIEDGSSVQVINAVSYGLLCDGNLTIANSSVQVSTSGYYGVSCKNTITIENSRVSSSASGCAFFYSRITLGEGIIVIEPEGGYTGSSYIRAADGARAAEAVIGPAIPYVDAQGNDMKPVTEFTVVSADVTAWSTGWYVVKENTRIEGRIIVSGDVNLILCDGATLTAVKGITVEGSNSLTIWQQKDGTGKLYAGTTDGSNITAPENMAGIGSENSRAGAITINGGVIDTHGGSDRGAGIGGNRYNSCSIITINGGNINAKGANYAAGIGNGPDNEGTDNGKVVINGGTVNASSNSNGAGIGGGTNGTACEVEINGGTVTAKGGDNSAGIGGGNNRSGAVVTINGGYVTANGGSKGAGIGGGNLGEGGVITINDGEVHANGGFRSAGIGGGDYGPRGTITINGGKVYAVAGWSGTGIGAGQQAGREGPADNGVITITGGYVYAKGGDYGPGIGTAYGGAWYSANGTVIITGGTVDAIGGNYGAGIGGGSSAPGNTIIITGGTVTAQAGSGAEAIGHGDSNDDPCDLTIDGMRAYNSSTATEPVAVDQRVDACHGSWVKLEVCSPHRYNPDVCEWCGADANGAVVFGKSLSLKGKIALNVYLFIPEAYTEDADLYVTIGEEKFPVSEAKTVAMEDHTLYLFTISVKFCQLTEEYTLRLYSGEDELMPLVSNEGADCTETGYIFSAQDYIDQVLAESDDEKLVALVTALSDVGSLSQLQFNYNVGERSELLGDLSAITADSVSAYAPVISSKAGMGISYYGSSLLLTDDTTIRHYFIVKGDLSQFTFKVDGKTVQPVKKGSYYYIEISGVVAKDLNRFCHVEVSNAASGVIISLDYSALSYVWKNLSKGGDETLLNLLRALTLYSQAADAYFGS